MRSQPYRSHRQAHLRAWIIATAQQLIAEHGRAAVTIDDIAARLHISKQTLYRYTRSKDELIEQATTCTLHQAQQAIAAIIAAPVAPCVQLEQMMTLLVHLSLHGVVEGACGMSSVSTRPPNAAACLAALERQLEAWLGRVQTEVRLPSDIQAGDLSRVLCAFAAIGSQIATPHVYAREHEGIERLMVQMLCRGMHAPLSLITPLSNARGTR